MRGNLLDSTASEPGSETQPRGPILIGAVAALLVTGLVFAGYLVLQRRHQQQALTLQQARVSRTTEPKGPVKAQIFVDDPLLKGDQTVLGGTIKNISSETLNNLSVRLELIRRKGGESQRASAPVEPTQIGPQQEGHYSLQLRSADYSSVKLAGLSSGGSPSLAYVSAPGQKRAPEKLAGKTIIVNQPGRSNNGFLNTPDTPGRIR
jgi:hypothetical protein